MSKTFTDPLQYDKDDTELADKRFAEWRKRRKQIIDEKERVQEMKNARGVYRPIPIQTGD